MFGAILNSSSQKSMIFCLSIYLKKVMKLLAFIFEQPSYLLTNERYKAYQTGFYSPSWVMHRDGTWGYTGGLRVEFFLSEIQPDLVCELLT